MAASKTLATKLHTTVWFLTLSVLESEAGLGKEPTDHRRPAEKSELPVAKRPSCARDIVRSRFMDFKKNRKKPLEILCPNVTMTAEPTNRPQVPRASVVCFCLEHTHVKRIGSLRRTVE